MRRLLAALLIASLIPLSLRATPTFAHSAYCGDNSGAGGSSASLTCVANPNLTGGANTALYVGVQGSLTADRITGVTFNSSETLTKIGVVEASAGFRYISLWRRYAPTTGSHTLVASSSPPDYIQIYWIEYSGVCSTTQEDVSVVQKQGSASTTFTGTITPTNGSTRIFTFFNINGSAGPIDVSAGNTSRATDLDFDSGDIVELNAAGTASTLATVQGVAHNIATVDVYGALTTAVRDSVTGCGAGGSTPSRAAMTGLGKF